MCGIAGYWGEGSEEILYKMIRTLHHRGPDDFGVYTHKKVGLSQSRLSILDLSMSGHQPMFNEDKTVCIIFNGEIYNYLELKKSLLGRHIFSSQTDTEVIIHLYEELGDKVFGKLHGMFALAILDLKNNILFLARDRMGKKPLYWSNLNGTLIFGSELKALMAHPLFYKDIDLASLNKYFQFEYIPTPHTIFRNTFKLEPGTFMSFDGQEIKKVEYWQPRFLPKHGDFASSLEELDKNLHLAVNDRLVADVPVGVFLSGGIDSSLIAYYAGKNSSNKVKTFSIGFDDSSFDESIYARIVASKLNTEHYERIITANECMKLIPEVVDFLDEPMADASIIPTYFLSKFASEHVTVALGGDGGDELFAGYDPFVAHQFVWIYEKIPISIRNILELTARHLPTSLSNMSLDFKIKKFLSGFNGDKNYRNQRWLGAFERSERGRMFNGEIWQLIKDLNEFEDIDTYFSKSDSKDFFDNLILEYERMYLMDQILVKVDRASMFNSLEVRAPFLDTRVVELANRLPISFKLRGLKRKYILKKLMTGKIPKKIIFRKKKGFGMPIARWINGDMKPFVIDVLSEKSIKEIGLFDPNYVEQILDDHFRDRKDNRKQIWTLIMFTLWWKKWFKDNDGV